MEDHDDHEHPIITIAYKNEMVVFQNIGFVQVMAIAIMMDIIPKALHLDVINHIQGNDGKRMDCKFGAQCMERWLDFMEKRELDLSLCGTSKH